MSKSQHKTGRPSRKAVRPRPEAAHPLAADPADIDPRAVLAAIAADPGQSGTARVAAAKALLASEPAEPKTRADDLASRAVRILAGRTVN